MDKIKGIFIAAAIVLGASVAWFTSNFFYTLFWAYLDRWKFKEADVIAYTLANLTPFSLVIVLSAIFYFFVRREMAKQIALSPARLREIEAQEIHAAELRRHTDALEREERANTPIQLALKAAFEHKGQAQVRHIVGEPLEPFPNWAMKNPPALDDSIAEYLPDVRVADSLAAQRLFEGKDGDNLIPLLEAEKIFAWARPMGRGEPAPIRVPGNVWRTNQMWVMPKGDNPHMRNQTFIKTKTTNETSYYDLRLNCAQLKRVWPNFEYATPSPVVPWPDFDKWDKRTNFRLFEIACLWTDREPGLPLTAEAVQCFKVLEQAIWDKHLKIRSESVREAIVSAIAISEGRESKANPNWVIDKDALLLYAAGTNEKPRFLFPEERV